MLRRVTPSLSCALAVAVLAACDGASPQTVCKAEVELLEREYGALPTKEFEDATRACAKELRSLQHRDEHRYDAVVRCVQAADSLSAAWPCRARDRPE